ncbi:MAG TPA: type II toxin-antitoxin system RelE/ParE family toxin [Fulvivirga sp.]|nr:type II toxin-antitoxin system RelE/ParE family toxin [Fulvivirga sp.]
MTIFWTKKSKTKFLEIAEYIQLKFGSKSSEKFTDKVLDFIELIRRFPELGSLEVSDKQIYGFQLTKQTKVFYRINKQQISILTFFDTCQNPEKKPK